MSDHLPVVAVIATNGIGRIPLLLDRALPSIARQSHPANLVLVVSDDDLLLKDDSVDIRDSFKPSFRNCVHLLSNHRTRGFSGTGSWNVGILESMRRFKDCWVAILDDDDEWRENHIEKCLEAAAKDKDCQWVASGIIRESRNSSTHEPLMLNQPVASDFFSTNPGIQGSNMFVRVGLLMKAGLFDEALRSTTDRDICIRLADVLGDDDAFVSTGIHTVVHYADKDRPRVSAPGSRTKTEGLVRFYMKHGARMSNEEREAFLIRAVDVFGCDRAEFGAKTTVHEPVIFWSWAGDELPLVPGTAELLPPFHSSDLLSKIKRNALFGIITSDINRVLPLLDDLAQAFSSSESNFTPFVILFANSDSEELGDSLKAKLADRGISGFVLTRSPNGVVDSILNQCHNVDMTLLNGPLPIALSRTVIQVFIFNILGYLEDISAVVILDDDKRLPFGWSPFITCDQNSSVKKKHIFIGRDLRTPPNPSLLSMRTNLIDLLYALDLHHAKGRDNMSLCCTHEALWDKQDWYYDLSSSRYNHLEMPVHKENGITDDILTFLRKKLSDFLRGTPMCRDVVPPSGPCDTEQRGGCMVILNEGDESFLPLAIQQHAPVITLSNNKTTHSRRSDSFWCKSQKKSEFKIRVHEKLYVYHDNQFDSILTASAMRSTVVQELIGGILCRGLRFRECYKTRRMIELRAWLLRIQGILITLRNRSYFTKEMVGAFIEPLEQIFESQAWETEVFSIVEREFDSIKSFISSPMDFSTTLVQEHAVRNSMVQIDEATRKELMQSWNKPRIEKAQNRLREATGAIGTFVGVGNEGVSCVNDEFLYKVFDKDVSGLSAVALEALGASLVKHNILRRPFYTGELYRGGSGPAMLNMLRDMRAKNLYHSNISPDNLLLTKVASTDVTYSCQQGKDYTDKKHSILMIIDMGRDLHFERNQSVYDSHFEAMCKRAYLTFRYGIYASNAHTLGKLKAVLRTPTAQQLLGFDKFMELIIHGSQTEERLLEKISTLNSVCCGIVADSICPHLPFKTIITENEDDQLISEILGAVESEMIKCKSRPIALVIQDPFSNSISSIRRPIWFYKRHLCRFQVAYSVKEENISATSQDDFGEYTKYHLFTLIPRNGCYLLIKSCPMEHKVIVSNVRRMVHSLEQAMSFKKIFLLADISKTDNFIRQYEPSNVEAYQTALHKIKQERLVDQVLVFDGKDTAVVEDLNHQWFGHKSFETHSSSGQQYASTFWSFKFIKEFHDYSSNDLLLQIDSDILTHCDNSLNGFAECASEFYREPELVTFAFPILSEKLSRPVRQYTGQDGLPLRMEIRCSFIHIDRLFKLLPLTVSPNECSFDDGNFCLRRGWWHALDDNIKSRGKKSCRGSLANNTWFFIHPQNDMKQLSSVQELHLTSDVITSNLYSLSDLKRKVSWKFQLGKVDLQSSGDWLPQRPESIVVAFHLQNTSEKVAVRSFKSLLQHAQTEKFNEWSVVVLDNGSSNHEDVMKKIFNIADGVFSATPLTKFCSRSLLLKEHVLQFLQRICTNPKAKVFIIEPNENFELQRLMLPLKYCDECSFFDGSRCGCYIEDANFTHTSLPIDVPAYNGNPGWTQEMTLYATEIISEGDQNIELAVLVKGNDSIGGVENVSLRVHSECLTGDVFYSLKCDCGQQKLKFMHMMKNEEHSVLLYIKGHEGRGAGLFNKIKSYRLLDSDNSKSHIDTLHEIGCESDVREYNVAFDFLKHKLCMQSVNLFSNNPHKIKAAQDTFGFSNVKIIPMPAALGTHNEKYLEEKAKLCGHVGLLAENGHN